MSGRPSDPVRAAGRRRAVWIRPSLVGLALALLSAGAGRPGPARVDAQPVATPEASRAYLPLLQRSHLPTPPAWPDDALAESIWRAAVALESSRLGPAVLPGDAPEAGGPSADNVDRNVEAACHDFFFPEPSDDPFGEQAHHRACYAWVAANRGLWHAARARRARLSAPIDGSGAADPELARDLAWAGFYLDDLLDTVTPFVYGAEDLPEGQRSFRDSLAALWQNPWRGADILLLADLLRQADALDAQREARSIELMAAIALAWQAHYRSGAAELPNSGVPFTSSAFPEVVALSPAGRQVASRFVWTFRWDADKGNSQAEEVSWSGASAMLIGRALAHRLPAAESIAEQGRRWVDYSLVFDRLNPRDGNRIRSLNAETEGGAYGQRRYWLENHSADLPSIPYAGYAWLAIGTALFASDAGPQQAWPSLAPDAAAWAVMRAAAEESLLAPDGSLLVRFAPRVDYAMERWPDWTTGCRAADGTSGSGAPQGIYRAGTHYVRYTGQDPLAPAYVSEIGHPAGLDLMNMAWPIMQVARARGDDPSYAVWRWRLDRVLAAYTREPPNPAWTRCRVAPYVSGNPGYHVPRMLSGYVLAWLNATGYQVEPW